MPKLLLTTIASYCDRILRTNEVQDYDGAVNGLQVENRGVVTRLAATVDASLATVKLAIAAGADLLIVHHGLFWSPSHPWTGKKYELLRLLLENNLAVYSSHLPLDAHPRLGNNAQLCAALGLKKLKPFFFSHGRFIGFQARQRISARGAGQTIGARDRRETASDSGRTGNLPEHWRGDRRRGRRFEAGRRGRRGHVHHRRRPALDICARGGTGRQCALRRPLCNRNLRGEGAGGAPCQKVQSAVEVR